MRVFSIFVYSWMVALLPLDNIPDNYGFVIKYFNTLNMTKKINVA